RCEIPPCPQPRSRNPGPEISPNNRAKLRPGYPSPASEASGGEGGGRGEPGGGLLGRSGGDANKRAPPPPPPRFPNAGKRCKKKLWFHAASFILRGTDRLSGWARKMSRAMRRRTARFCGP